MLFVRGTRRAATLLAAAAVAACSDSTAPTIDYIDAQAAVAKAQPVVAVMDQPAFASFASLADAGGLPTSQSGAAFAAVARMTTSAVRGGWDGSTPLLARSAARSADVLPADVRGRLYTYSETTHAYEGAASADAPANGIRIILYATDPLSGRPSSPLSPVGYVDLEDESTAQTNRLRVQLLRNDGNLDLLNYVITHSVSTSSESFSIVGSATDGVTPVAFDLSGVMSETEVSVTFELAAPSAGLSVEQRVHLNALTERATFAVELGYDGHTLAFTASLNANGMTGEVKYDGMRYATFSMTYDETTGEVTSQFTKANGQPLTAEDLEAITGVFERALGFGEFVAGLLWPLGALAPTV